MQLLFQSTEAFERDLEALTEPERIEIISMINTRCPSFTCERQTLSSLVYQPREIQLTNECCPSLSVMPAGPDRAIILAVDEDPVFDQLIVSLFRLVAMPDVPQAYSDVACTLYHRHMVKTAGEGRADG